MNLALQIFHSSSGIVHSDIRIFKAQAIAEGVSNLAVQLQVIVYSLCVLQRVKADRAQLNTVTLQLITDQVMLLRSQHLTGLGKIQLKINIPRSILQIGVIDELDMHNCFAVFQNDAVQLIFRKGNLAAANLELSVQIGSMHSSTEGFVELLKAFVNSLIGQLFNAQVNFIAAVKANHAVTVKQSLNDFLFGFQAGSISAVAFLVALFEHAPGCGIHSLYKVTLQSLAVLGSKINQYRFQLTFTKQLCHNRICLAQPIAEADAGTLSAAGSRCGPFNIAAHQRSIIRV